MSIQPDLVLAACPACGNPIVKLDHVQKCVDKLKNERRGFQIMARQTALHADPGFWMTAIADGKYERAGGNAECRECRIEFFEHPQLPGYPTFHILCSGEIVKT